MSAIDDHLDSLRDLLDDADHVLATPEQLAQLVQFSGAAYRALAARAAKDPRVGLLVSRSRTAQAREQCDTERAAADAAPPPQSAEAWRRADQAAATLREAELGERVAQAAVDRPVAAATREPARCGAPAPWLLAGAANATST